MTISRRAFVGYAALFSALISAWSPAVLATPIYASMSVTGMAQLDCPNRSAPCSPSVYYSTDSSSAAWGTLLSPLGIDAKATVANPATGSSLTVSGAGSATWGTGGDTGTISFSNYGWTTLAPAGAKDSEELARLNTGGPDWAYTFQADSDGTFTMDFNVTASGDPFGLWGWNIDWNSAPGLALGWTKALDPTASGTFIEPLIAGQIYTVSLQNFANISSSGKTFANGSMNGLFTFDITADLPPNPPPVIPEPGSLTFFAAGLASCAALWGRKKRKIA